MTTIAHISDLHFGTEDPAVVEALVSDILALQPTLIVVSGDLTQRATAKQFLAARDFLHRLPFPQVVIPGNHDISLFNVWRRFTASLQRYKAYITEEMYPFYVDDDIAVLGINTARSFTWKSGWISNTENAQIMDFFGKAGAHRRKILVTHHPFIRSSQVVHDQIRGRWETAVMALDMCGVDVVLSGHLHKEFTGDSRRFYPRASRSILIVQAGTAVSRRLRTEANSYNVLIIGKESITVNVRMFDGALFSPYAEGVYGLESSSWQLPERSKAWAHKK